VSEENIACLVSYYVNTFCSPEQLYNVAYVFLLTEDGSSMSH